MQRRTDTFSGTIPTRRVSGLTDLKRTGRGLLLVLLMLLATGCAAAAPDNWSPSASQAEHAAVAEIAPAELRSSSSGSQSSASRTSPPTGRRNRRGRQPDPLLPPVVADKHRNDIHLRP